MNCELKDKLKGGGTAFGTWVTVGHPDVPDLLEAMGFEWLLYDMEHAPLTIERVAQMVQSVDSAKTCPIVRVGAVDQWAMKGALDAGAHGIMCPLVSTKEQAEEAVRFMKYPPRGVRGTAPRKAADFGLSFPDYLRSADSMTSTVVQIETTEALKNLDQILSVEGVDVAFVGPSDLTMSMGLSDDRNNPKVVEAMKRVISACEAHGKTPGVLAATPEEAKRDVELGFRFIGLGSDTRFLVRGAKEFFASARKS